jgi:hypothetical protein
MFFMQAAYSDMKWANYKKIDSRCWVELPSSTPSLIVGRLDDQWCDFYFQGAYKSIKALSFRSTRSPLAIVFLTPQGLYEVRIFSRLRPGDYYDFCWAFSLGVTSISRLDDISNLNERFLPIAVGDPHRRAIPISRLSNGANTGSANAVWIADPTALPATIPDEAKNIRIFCAELDETIDLNLESLSVRVQESVVEKQSRNVPWHRLLFWMWKLRSIDSAAFGKIAPAIRSYLTSVREQAGISALQDSTLKTWQTQGLLPSVLPLMNASDLIPLRDSVLRQQGLARSPEILSQFMNQSPFPKLLLNVNASQLDALDLQSFMTIGALREIHGFTEIETQRLIERRPDLQALLQTPQGQRRFFEDSEVVALRSHPNAIREQLDLADVGMRGAGSFGPTARDMQLAALQQNANQMLMLATMDPIAGLLSAMQAPKNPAQAEPAWKLYRPYLC